MSSQENPASSSWTTLVQDLLDFVSTGVSPQVRDGLVLALVILAAVWLRVRYPPRRGGRT